jgi:hypothetical protein
VKEWLTVSLLPKTSIDRIPSAHFFLVNTFTCTRGFFRLRAEMTLPLIYAGKIGWRTPPRPGRVKKKKKHRHSKRLKLCASECSKMANGINNNFNHGFLHQKDSHLPNPTLILVFISLPALGRISARKLGRERWTGTTN